MNTAKILTRLFEMSGLTQDEFVKHANISTSQFYKILSQAKIENSKPDYYLSTLRNWVATSANHVDDLHDEWLNLVFKLYLDETVMTRLTTNNAKTKSPWYKAALQSFFPSSAKLLIKK